MRWFGRRREGTGDPGAGPREKSVGALREDSKAAELIGRQGDAAEAAARYTALVARAERDLGPRDTDTWALRHQLAHWIGESGQPEAAVRQFTQLLADRERNQGPRHRDTELARHQLAHWHGRSGRPEEAVRRYEAMRRMAERENRTEAALTLLCDVGYWQQKSGDNAAALRAFSHMLKTAQEEFGPDHQLVNIARQRYAEVAGSLPFGNEGGQDGLQDLRATAAAVEAAGDLQRAARMYEQIAARCEQLYGPGSPDTLSALVVQAQAAVTARDYATAVDSFGKVLACMELQGQGPGSPEYGILRGQRDELARMARHAVLRIAQPTATLLGESVQGAPETLCAVLAREPGAAHSTRLSVVNDGADDVSWRRWTVEQWTALLRNLSRRGYDATALCFARDDLRPTPEEALVCERLRLPGVYVSRLGEENVRIDAYVFADGEPTAAHVVLVADERPESAERELRKRLSAEAADDRIALHPGAAA
ncbi:tetratricopeptide repeat protein, partial [Streptomyces sp. SID6139]|nr:tetratricopeptide repeat protein [Streptomyces sp. SID6139]